MKNQHFTFQKVPIKNLILYIIGLIVLAGCGQSQVSSLPSDSLPESEWKIGQGDLLDQTGHIHKSDQTPTIPDTHLFSMKEIFEKTEYNRPTGSWLLHNGNGKFGYGLTSGTKQAGDEYYVSLIGHKSNGESLNKNVRIQLTERDHLLRKKEVIEDVSTYIDIVTNEEVIYSAELPAKENITYLLSIEILDDNGNIEDTMVRVIYVPAIEINAYLTLDQEIYHSFDEIATLRLTNIGPTYLFLGTPYSIEKKIDNSWKVVPLDLAFNEIGIILGPEDDYEQAIEIHQLTPGNYRVIKDFQADGTDLSETLAVEFTIE